MTRRHGVCDPDLKRTYTRASVWALGTTLFSPRDGRRVRAGQNFNRQTCPETCVPSPMRDAHACIFFLSVMAMVAHVDTGKWARTTMYCTGAMLCRHDWGFQG